ncbi:hypothetical protein GUJ93_ZPchr0011g28427 [Zizania palustris]|uniref:Late embryogenesis abundant protein LEA-2 subgroup domain-containing protein n=1 Tax=Zizania palustris TaxID=103762 RepID=A0A8J5WH27_ZIZPA|nr:hypothetical protein GUJ93_ZPchr0011g28427 [Zizania palustris]
MTHHIWSHEAHAIQHGSSASRNNTVAFTFQQLASVHNPNRAPLAHYDSSLRVAYGDGEISSIYIPAGQIDGGRTQYATGDGSADGRSGVAVAPVPVGENHGCG